MGESKIISCKIYPLIHYPLLNFAFSSHCNLTKDPGVKSAYSEGIKHYDQLLRKLKLDGHYLYLRECFDILQLSPDKVEPLIRSPKYDIISLEEFKTYLIAEPSCI
jgi:hypothetical protein